MVGNLSSDGVTTRTLFGRILKTHKPNIMKIRNQKIRCIGRCANKPGQRPPVRNQDGVEMYDAGIKSSPKHRSDL